MLQVLLLASAFAQGSAAAQSRIMATIEEVSIERGVQQLSAETGDQVQSGDRIACSKGGGAIWYYSNSAIVYLGPESTAEIAFDDARVTVTLLRGEIRVVGSGEHEIFIRWLPQQAERLRGIVISGEATGAPLGVSTPARASEKTASGHSDAVEQKPPEPYPWEIDDSEAPSVPASSD